MLSFSSFCYDLSLSLSARGFKMVTNRISDQKLFQTFALNFIVISNLLTPSASIYTVYLLLVFEVCSLDFEQASLP